MWNISPCHSGEVIVLSQDCELAKPKRLSPSSFLHKTCYFLWLSIITLSRQMMELQNACKARLSRTARRWRWRNAKSKKQKLALWPNKKGAINLSVTWELFSN